MAKYYTTITALFCLLTLSLAAHAAPENDGVPAQISLPTTEKQSKPPIVTSLTLTKIPFRAVNRRFPVRSKHPCRHHRPAAGGNEEIPYTILSSGENSDFKESVIYGGGRRLRPHNHRHDGADRVAMRRHDYDRFDREKELKVLKKLRKHLRVQKEEKKMKRGGFMSKFLDFYF